MVTSDWLMASKIICVAPYEAENQFEFSLRQVFNLLLPKLRPPFRLQILNAQEYSEFNQAILYGVLCEPPFAKVHLKYLHALVTDGYGLVVHFLQKVVDELYVKLIDSAKSQIIWLTKEMIDVCAVGVDNLLVSLLRQTVGGDFSEGNLWLCFELVNIFLSKWSCLLEEIPQIISSALYTFLRLLADHYRISSAKLESLKQLEIQFCIKVIKEQFCFCMKIGRDFVRLLQDLIHVPEFKAIWKELLLNPSNFKTSGFFDISQLYCTRTSSRYSLLRISLEMEAQLRFLMTSVKLGCQKRYQGWFAKKFLHGSEGETIIPDIIRFICCAHHPPNEVIQSDILPRWAIIGWLLKCCRKHYIEANAKLALFYDWLFFDDAIDNIMNIEPAMLLMIYSIPRYIDMVHTLLEFLFLLVENYDAERKGQIASGVSSAFNTLIKKGVIPSLDILTSFDGLSPFLKNWLRTLSSGREVHHSKELQLVSVSGRSVTPQCFSNKHCAETPTISFKIQSSSILSNGSDTRLDVVPTVVDSTSHNSVIADMRHPNNVDILVKKLGEMNKQSNDIGLKTLEELLFLFPSLVDDEQISISASAEILFSKIVHIYEQSRYKLFASLDVCPNNFNYDDEVGSATALMIRTFIFHQGKMIQEMLLFCSRNGFPVGARLLSYVSRLAYEAGYTVNASIENSDIGGNDLKTQLLLFHLNGYFSLRSGIRENPEEMTLSRSEIDKNLVANLVKNAFSAYRYFLAYSKDVLYKDSDVSLSRVFSLDLTVCTKWNTRRVKFLFCCAFDHLSGLCECNEEIVKLLLTLLDYTDFVGLQFEIIKKKFSIFGKNAESIFNLIRGSLDWGCLEQHKLWSLIRSELIVSKFQECIVIKLLYSGVLDAKLHPVAVEGILYMCCCCAPSTELVGAIMLLPNNVFEGLSTAVLAAWVVSNESMLLHSLSNFSEKLSKMNEGEITINHSVIMWLGNYFNANGMSNSPIYRNLYENFVGAKEI